VQEKLKSDQDFTGFETELDYQKFLNPPAVYRSFPFYSLNDKLEADEISRQISAFKDAGFGGFYLHSRAGLLTEYLGNDWWNIMDAAVDAAGKAGLNAWFYDEDKWPSGYAGGIIPRMDINYRAKCLARIGKDIILPEGATVLKEDKQFRYIEYTAHMGNPDFNGTCYVDLFNPDVVTAFIRVSYQPYIQRYKENSGSAGFGIFTDEPHIHARYFDRETPHQGTLSYSPCIADKFKELWDYELSEKIELLFEEKENWREVRLHYYRTVALQFEESFSRQISGYCTENGIIFTGHFLGEDALEKVRDRIGNAMLHYRNMQQPGMDHLGLSIHNNLITARSLSSVANQYDKSGRLSEIFGISGQNMNFEDRKWIAGWHAVLGINHFCPHLTLYSLKGIRKRDYPPTFSYHQPYWPYNKTMEDYLGRLSYATSVGRYDPQFLIINPLESEYIKGINDKEFSSGLILLMEAMQEAHFDYDLGDEQIMADTAFMKNGRLFIGTMSYPNIILPDMISIRASTAELLMSLADSGGQIFNTGRFPEYIDGKEDPEKLSELKEHIVELDTQDPAIDLSGYVHPNVILTSNKSGDIWSHVRKTKDGVLILLSNISHTETIRFSISSDLLSGNVVLWNPSEGKCYKMNNTNNGSYEIELPSSSSVWLTSGDLSNSARIEGSYKLPVKRELLLTLEGDWEGKRLDPNAITLDFARYSVDNGKNFSKPEPVIGIFNRLSDIQFNGTLVLDYPVHVTAIPGSCSLVVEQPEIYNSITVNSQPVRFDTKDFYLDHSFPVAEISDLTTIGENTVTLTLDFIPPSPESEKAEVRYGTEIESIYLVGDFGVYGLFGTMTMQSQRNESGDFQVRPVYGFQAFTITSEQNLFSGHLTVEGYPFYAGEFELSLHFEVGSVDRDKHYWLELPNTEAIVSKIELNGKNTGSLTWSPFIVDIGDAIKSGDNILRITLVNSLRNLLGPHHHQKAELIKVGPNSFTGYGGFPDPAGDKDWYDLRKQGSDLEIWTDTYYHIPFGFLEPVRITVSID